MSNELGCWGVDMCLVAAAWVPEWGPGSLSGTRAKRGPRYPFLDFTLIYMDFIGFPRILQNFADFLVNFQEFLRHFVVFYIFLSIFGVF